jgi:hypothetical protein
MPSWKEGQRARVVTRPVTEEDRESNRYYSHMAGLVGTIQSVYSKDEVSLQIDLDTLTPVSKAVHKDVTDRMRERFATETSEEQKKQLTKEEMEFTPHYVLLVRESDLEAV